jgi:hypothetical protein|tara:strand:+ start:557 stop:784 length:228 start_codon:yes stop_codon:yes gene_type:complete
MSFQIVKCEVRWCASIGYSGNELPAVCNSSLGEFETENDAKAALTAAGFKFNLWRWKDGTGYGEGSLSRVLKELV